MKVTIKGSPKEIAALAMGLQERQKSHKNAKNSKLIRKQLERLSEASQRCLSYHGCEYLDRLADLTQAMTDLLSLQNRS